MNDPVAQQEDTHGGLRGIFPIIYTAFHDDGRLDEPSQRRLVDWLIDSGAHGLAPVGGASETGSMTPEERRALLELCVDQTAGRVPLVMGCTAPSTEDSIEIVRHGASLGVRAAFGLLPSGAPGSGAQGNQQQLKGDELADAFRRHYLALGEASTIPIMVQEVGHPIPPELILDVFERCPNVCYVKEEAPDTGHRISALMEMSGGRLRIFSGGLNLMDDLARGAIGAIPGSIGVADLATAYNLHVAGDREGARRAFNHFLPLSHWRRQFNPQGTKEMLRRLGIVDGIHTRNQGGQRMDQRDLDELTEVMALMGPPY